MILAIIITIIAILLFSILGVLYYKSILKLTPDEMDTMMYLYSNMLENSPLGMYYSNYIFH